MEDLARDYWAVVVNHPTKGDQLKSPYRQRTTVVLYTDIGTAKRNRGRGQVLKLKLSNVEVVDT